MGKNFDGLNDHGRGLQLVEHWEFSRWQGQIETTDGELGIMLSFGNQEEYQMSTGQSVEHEITIGGGPLTVKIIPTQKGHRQPDVKVSVVDVEFTPDDGSFMATRIDDTTVEFHDEGKEATAQATIIADATTASGKTKRIQGSFSIAAVEGTVDALDFDFQDPVDPSPGPTPGPAPEPGPGPGPGPGPVPGPGPGPDVPVPSPAPVTPTPEPPPAPVNPPAPEPPPAPVNPPAPEPPPAPPEPSPVAPPPPPPAPATLQPAPPMGGRSRFKR